MAEDKAEKISQKVKQKGKQKLGDKKRFNNWRREIPKGKMKYK